MVRERTSHLPSYVKATKMKLLTLHTHGFIPIGLAEGTDLLLLLHLSTLLSLKCYTAATVKWSNQQSNHSGHTRVLPLFLSCISPRLHRLQLLMQLSAPEGGLLLYPGHHHQGPGHCCYGSYLVSWLHPHCLQSPHLFAWCHPAIKQLQLLIRKSKQSKRC